MRRTKKLASTAYHEAGHAIVDLLTGKKIHFVTIDPKRCDVPGARGMVSYEDASKKDIFCGNLSDKAGNLAQIKARPIHKSRDPAHYDSDSIYGFLDILGDFGTDSSKAHCISIKLTELTQAILSEYWPLVDLLANALLEKEYMTGQEVEDLLKDKIELAKEIPKIQDRALMAVLEAFLPDDGVPLDAGIKIEIVHFLRKAVELGIDLSEFTPSK